MKKSGKIKLKGLMASDAARRIFAALQDGEKEPLVLFVGGCVRNMLLGKPVSDIDLATKLSPSEVTARLKKAGANVIPTGIDHGTVTAIFKHETFQITTLRHDIETDGRRAKVAYTDDWVEDARRRDFTLNTLLADISGNIYDPLGDGLADLKRGKIIFVGDPVARIREDYLRIFRFFRFHAYYGTGRPDQRALVACKSQSSGIKTLSKERVTQELCKILLSDNVAKIIPLMIDHKVLNGLVNAKFEAPDFNYLKKLEDVDFVSLGLLILAGFSKSGTVRIENRLRLKNIQQKQMDGAVVSLKKFKKISTHELKVLLYRHGAEIAELTLVSRLILDRVPVAQAKKWISLLRNMERPVLPLRGQDLIDRGMKPGPAIKAELEKFEKKWLKSL